MSTSHRGRTFFLVFVAVGLLGWTAGSLGLDAEKRQVINRVEQNWHKDSTTSRDWRDITDASGEVIIQQAFVGGGSCTSGYWCTTVVINPKYYCSPLTVTVEWHLKQGDKLLQTKTYNLGATTSMQPFEQTLDSTVDNNGDGYYDMVSAKCTNKRYA